MPAKTISPLCNKITTIKASTPNTNEKELDVVGDLRVVTLGWREGARRDPQVTSTFYPSLQRKKEYLSNHN
jgi:hypothetical protein